MEPNEQLLKSIIVNINCMVYIVYIVDSLSSDILESVIIIVHELSDCCKYD